MKPILTYVLACLPLWVCAQDATVTGLKKDSEKEIKKDPKDTIPRTWKTGGTFNLNVNQGSLSNWSAGGEDFSFSVNAYLNLFAYYQKNRHSWDNTLDLAYGFVQTTSLGKRKASDRIDLTSRYGHALTKRFSLSTLFNLRSQFANGYAYNKNAAGQDSASLTSKSLTPAYIILSTGVSYKPVEGLSVFLSPVTARWVVVGDPGLRSFYGVDPGKSARSEFGAFLTLSGQVKLGKSFQYRSKLDLFSNYRKDPENIDVFWTNVITAKITPYINFSFNLDMIYDNDTQNVDPEKGPAPQWLQLMGIGFAYTFKNGKK